MIPTADLNIGFQGLALIQGQIYNTEYVFPWATQIISQNLHTGILDMQNCLDFIWCQLAIFRIWFHASADPLDVTSIGVAD